MRNLSQGGIAKAGSFLEKAAEILQSLDSVAQLGALGASEALQTKQDLLKVSIN